METTQILMKEHEIIKSIIRESAEKISMNKRMSIEDFDYYFNFFVNFADTYHHKKEENIYFEWLLHKDANLKHGPVGVMLHDHESLRKVLREARNFLQMGEYEEFKNAYMQFCDGLYNHIYKEDNILYKLAEKMDKEFADGDMLMLENFYKIQRDEDTIYSQWKNHPIHEEVQRETDQLQANKGQCGGCCGMC